MIEDLRDAPQIAETHIGESTGAELPLDFLSPPDQPELVGVGDVGDQQRQHPGAPGRQGPREQVRPVLHPFRDRSDVLAGAGAYAFHRGADNFWGVVTCGLIAVWALFSMLPVMDSGWRLKVGFVAVTFCAGFVALWPTLENVSGGKFPCPWYFKSHITFGIAPGLDLRGGLRLVYTVEVEEAIRDKTLRYADDMRSELSTIYALHSGEWKMTGGAERAESILVASEPLTRDTSSWVELPEYGALFAEIRSGRPYVSVKLLD